ncbi:proton-conducting transporter transmembrane domain-containing protein [Halostella litorea]|uniref:proton-conducting transporter transmembrane domain-containing protein n=1 Tax=Halostella litorea TaxID=2528831 RepID=UPI0010921899|nr:proton-conducting transporter membrane subunit [Halostella litorea]
MTGQSHTNGPAQLSETSPSSAGVPRATTAGVWALFALSLATVAVSDLGGYEWHLPGYVVVDALTTVVWVVVTFFSGIVHSYSRRYMAGDAAVDRFFGRTFAFTLAVMAMAAADHVALFAAAWLAMGLTMASLIGHVRGWDQARAAGSLARRYFLASGGLLGGTLALLAWATETTAVSGIVARAGSLPADLAWLAIGGLFLAAMIQSALFPFHGWLLSSMTAPTPASALMHAGFVNAGGILLTRFAPLYADVPAAMSALVVVGAASALLGQALLLVRPDVKRKLGASTVAQMGFMILQCGLGFFAAAIAHLVLHGFYKAYLFLSAGETVERTAPTASPRSDPGLPGLAASFGAALAGGALFVAITGKGAKPDSGVLLALVVVLTALQAARDVLARSGIPARFKLVGLPVIVVVPVAVYGFLFEAVSGLLADVPMTAAPTDLTAVHLAVGALFVAAYLAVDRGWHRSSKRLYVALLNLSQPAPETVLTTKEDYNDA